LIFDPLPIGVGFLVDTGDGVKANDLPSITKTLFRHFMCFFWSAVAGFFPLAPVSKIDHVDLNLHFLLLLIFILLLCLLDLLGALTTGYASYVFLGVNELCTKPKLLT
jgi:hypothetical protein